MGFLQRKKNKRGTAAPLFVLKGWGGGGRTLLLLAFVI